MALALLILTIASLWHLHIIDRDMPPNKADIVAVWKGAQATLNRQDPYSDNTTRTIQRFYYGRELTSLDNVNHMGFAYPLYTTVVLAPLAHLSFNTVRLTFLWLVPALMAVTVPLWIRILNLRVTNSRAALLAVVYLISWPVLWGLRLLQPSMIVAVFLAFGLFSLRRGWNLIAGPLLAASLIKPQLVGIVLLWLLVWAALQRRWSFVVSFLATAASLFAWSSAVSPGWIARWRAAMADYTQYTHAQPELQIIFGKWLGAFLIATLLCTTAVVLWRLRSVSVEEQTFGKALSLSLAATIAVTPTDPPMVYNALFLLPPVLLLLHSTVTEPNAALARRIALAFVSWQFLAVPLAVVGETFTRPSALWQVLPFQSLILPITVFVAFLLYVQPVSSDRAVTVHGQP